MNANNLQKAKECCSQLKNKEQQQKYLAKIDELLGKNNNSNNAENLIDKGDVQSGLDLMVSQGQ